MHWEVLIIPAIAVPFTRDFAIDEPDLRRFAQWLAAQPGITRFNDIAMMLHRFGIGVAHADVERLRQPTDRVHVECIIIQVRSVADRANEGGPGVGVPQLLRPGLRAEHQHEVKLVGTRG